jgi:hypothetical protein
MSAPARVVSAPARVVTAPARVVSAPALIRAISRRPGDTFSHEAAMGAGR